MVDQFHANADSDSALILADFQKCYDIAMRLDAGNPTLPGAFTGSVSERIYRQLAAHGLPLFQT